MRTYVERPSDFFFLIFRLSMSLGSYPFWIILFDLLRRLLRPPGPVVARDAPRGGRHTYLRIIGM